MPSNRIGRTNDDIQRVLSERLRSVKDPRVNQGMLSITRVDATGDLRYAKIYISALGDVNEKELTKGLRSASGWLRRELANALSLRYTPELIFILDHSIEHGAEINRLISGLDIREDEEE
ncbi:MAG: 30S ribosome-binding factor RbfA [Oscillospiraceae bacterium]|nr:30S ribosome-binding factor RbfA [Oscillospiraceae bacterium]MBR6561974.1 30S ribosome-binding factor RbfA [Oscillospiraceae bacterium]